MSKKLFEETILEDHDLVEKIKSAVPGKPMTADQFKAWLASQ